MSSLVSVWATPPPRDFLGLLVGGSLLSSSVPSALDAELVAVVARSTLGRGPTLLYGAAFRRACLRAVSREDVDDEEGMGPVARFAEALLSLRSGKRRPGDARRADGGGGWVWANSMFWAPRGSASDGCSMVGRVAGSRSGVGYICRDADSSREGGKSQSRAAARTVSGGSITLQRPRPCPDLHSSAELSLSPGFLQRPSPSPPMRCIRCPSPLLIRGSLAFIHAFLPLTLPADTSALRMHKLPRSAVPFRPCACSSKDPGDPARHDFVTGRPASGSHALQSATLTRYSGTPF